MQQKGEHTLWSATGVFHETGRTASTYVGGSSGVSIPVGGGIRFRVGAMKGQVIPGEELQVDKDQGVVILTTNEDESDYFISVSNRQKTSGVRFDPVTGREFNRFLGSATAAHEHGYAELLAELKKMQKEAVGAEPKLLLSPALSTFRTL